MLKKKKLARRSAETKAVPYTKITQGMAPVKLSEAGEKPRNLTKIEIKSAQNYVDITTPYLEKTSLSADLEARCRCTRWTNLSALFFDAYLHYQKDKTNLKEIQANKSTLDKDKSNLEKIRAYKSALDQDYEKMFALLRRFLTEPKSQAISLETKHLMYPLIANYLQTFCQGPVFFAYTILLQDSSQVEAAKEQLAIVNKRFDNMSILFQEATPILAEEELTYLWPSRDRVHFESVRLSVQFERAKNINFGMIKMLQDFLYPPEKANDSFANSFAGLVQLFKSDPVLKDLTSGLEQLNQNTPMTSGSVIASSSSASGEENTLILSDSLDDSVIKTEFKKLIQCVDTPSFDQKTIETAQIREWLNHSARLEHLLGNLTHYIVSTFPKLRQHKLSLLSEENHSFEVLKSGIDEYRRVTHIILYFFRNIDANQQSSIKPQLYPLTMLAWELKAPCLSLINLMKKFEIPSGESLWYKNTQSFYWSSFETIYPMLFRIILLLITNSPIPEVNKEAIDFYKETLVGFVFLALHFHYSQILNNLCNNEIEKAKGSYQIATVLLRTTKINEQQLAEHTRCSIDGVQLQFADLSQNITKVGKILSSPLQEPVKFMQKLHQMELSFDETLVAKNHRPNTQVIESNQSDLVLKNLFAELHEHFSKGGTLLNALPLLEESLIPQLSHCFSADPGTNLKKAQWLQSVLHLCIGHSDSKDASQDLLLNHLKWYHFKIKKASLQWQDQSDRIEQPFIKQFFESLKQDAINFVPYHKADSTIKFQSFFQKDSFTQALDRALYSSSYELSVYELGAIIKLTAQPESALALHDNFLSKLYNMTTDGLTDLSVAEAEKVYIVWNNCVPDFIRFLYRLNESPSLISNFFHNIFCIKLNEVKLYYLNGLLATAMETLRNASVTLKEVAGHLNPAQLYISTAEVELLREQIENPYSIPSLLAYMLAPQMPSAICSDVMPLAINSLNFDKEQMLRFQNAWWSLKIVSENNLTPADALKIFTAWKDYFCTLSTIQITCDALQKHWKKHYSEYKQSLQKPKSAMFINASSSLAKSEKPSSAQSKSETDLNKRALDKTNLELLKEKKRLDEIERQNQRPRKKLIDKKKPRKQPAPEASCSDNLPLSRPLNEEIKPIELAVNTLSESDDSSGEKVVEIKSESKQRPVARSSNFNSYASAAKGSVIHLKDFPALPVSREKIAGSSAASSTSSSEENVPARYSLDPKYQYPKAVQNILDTLTNEQEGYFALLGGGYVRDLLREASPNDADIFTNCPPVLIRKFFPQSIESKNLSSLFCLDVPGENLVIDIKYMPLKTAHEVANNLDFTVNSFFINMKGELLIPLEEASNHLNNKVLKSIIPIDDSFTLDISRLWRMIRLSNQLEWSLDPEAKESIRKFASKLCNFTIQQFIINFNKCFTANESLALANLATFHELGLLPYLVSLKPAYTEIDVACLNFCKNELIKLFKKNDEGLMLINTVALFSLLHKAPSLAAYQRRADQWLNSFEELNGNGGQTSQYITTFKEELRPRLGHYYREFHREFKLKKNYNVNADSFYPYSAASNHSFWPPAQSPTKSDTVCMPQRSFD